MVFSAAGVSEWVAFEQGNNHGDGGFEAVVCPINKNSRPNKSDSKRGDSARRRNADSASVTSWMKQPINSDASWAPVAAPKSNPPSTEHPTANKRRPPRARKCSNIDPPTRRRLSSNPVSSSDSDASTADRPSRGRSVERAASSKSLQRSASNTKESRQATDSRRGRSRTRPATETVEAPSVQVSVKMKDRGRSSSRTRTTTPARDRSTSVTRTRPDRSTSVTRTRSSATTGSRSGSRPPPTSGARRSRSNSRTPVTRTRSTSRTRAAGARPPVAGARPPPSTTRTRREMRTPVPTSNSVGPGLPRRSCASNVSIASEDGHASLRSAPDTNIGRDISFGRTKSGRAQSQTVGNRSGFMEKLFGDQVSEEAKQAYLPRHEPSPTASVSSIVSWQQPEQIHSRILLTATVYHNTATNLWIATINTNQKGVAKNPAMASKYLKAFSFSSEKEARESAIANAPPKMLSFDDNLNCFICYGKFAMFRRASHCRNCGVCICNSCSTMWPARMIPDTYNLKKESQVKICKSCNFLSGAFKKALHDGDYEEAIALYGSGNVNLRTPFPQLSKKKEEIMYPIHCGVDGGNIDIVRWLMEDHFCPIKVIRTGSSKKPKRGGSADQPILTSKSRSVLTIALTGLHVDIMRYLVVENGVSIYESKDLKSSLRALEAVLLALPGYTGEHRADMAVPRWDDGSFDGSITSSLGVGSLGADQTLGDEGSKKTRNADSCIICYDNSINCVMTPCGHQVCCLQCSKNLSACPVCNVRGEFIKIFRP